MKTDAEKIAFRAICTELGERRPDSMDCLWLLNEAYGLAFMFRHVERAKEIYAGPGMRRPDGKRRTLGGCFFALVKQEIPPSEYRSITLTSWERRKRRKKRWAAERAAEAIVGDRPQMPTASRIDNEIAG